MRDVVVIGGGLSGLSACVELEKLGIAYTIIEVRRRFGGGIRSASQAGFITDACAFAFQRIADHALIEQLCLREQMIPISQEACLFRHGAESLVRALANRLTGGILTRMALSSIGRLGGRFTLCLENGLMLDAGALILAVPAPFAARMLWNLAPAAAERLSAFRYDAIHRVSLGYHNRDLPPSLDAALNPDFAFTLATDQPGRAPRDHRLIQVGLRNPDPLSAREAIEQATRYFGGKPPLIARVDSWAQADLLSEYDAAHREIVRAIRHSLPAGLSLIGSDYCLEAPSVNGIANLDERIAAGKRAAHDAVASLPSRGKR